MGKGTAFASFADNISDMNKQLSEIFDSLIDPFALLIPVNDADSVITDFSFAYINPAGRKS